MGIRRVNCASKYLGHLALIGATSENMDGMGDRQRQLQLWRPLGFMWDTFESRNVDRPTGSTGL